jgi:hypothetical protein
MGIKQIAQLFQSTRTIINYQKEREVLKGELFNVFSILKMETKENATHSAFLRELLDPQGSHLKRNIFLDLFLKTIRETDLDINSAKVKAEHYLGHRNDNDRTGGRVDIYIEDESGVSICIENKIYAGDQFAQIERYYNHNAEKNKVYYLNLFGSEPSIESKGILNVNEHFFILSYKEHIINWLRLCLKETFDSPILRETIRQYIILLQKLTNTMDNKEQSELMTLMLNNYEEASFIASNFNKAKDDIKESVRMLTYKNLRETISDRFEISCGKGVGERYSQIWLELRELRHKYICFGIETFSGHADANFGGDLFIGIYTGGNSNKINLPNKEVATGWWMNILRIPPYEGVTVNLDNQQTLIKLHSDSSFKLGFVEHIVKECISYLNAQEPSLVSFLQAEAVTNV